MEMIVAGLGILFASFCFCLIDCCQSGDKPICRKLLSRKFS